MKRGNSSNCVHWLYTVLTGTSTSMLFSTCSIPFSHLLAYHSRRDAGLSMRAPPDHLSSFASLNFGRFFAHPAIARSLPRQLTAFLIGAFRTIGKPFAQARFVIGFGPEFLSFVHKKEGPGLDRPPSLV